MELILVRHAESLFNCKQSLHPDSELSELGIKQAEQAGLFLFHYIWKLPALMYWQVHVSPFKRTKQTAEIIGMNLMLSSKYIVDYPKHNWDLREHIYPDNDFQEQMPIVIDEELGYVIDKHETKEECLERLKNFYFSLDKTKNHVIISHGTPVQALMGFPVGIFEIPEWDKSVKNCSITHFSDDKLLLDKYVGYQEGNKDANSKEV